MAHRILIACILVAVAFTCAPDFAHAATLSNVKSRDWDETHVRKVLHAFAYGGMASDEQIKTWADMRPGKAIRQMLTFDVNNELLSPAQDGSAEKCGSLAELQDFWSSDDPENPMTYYDRSRYSTLSSKQQFSEANLQRTWSKMITTRGCNPFLHKMALFLTNYHASIHISSVRVGLMRDYYDDYLAALASGAKFIDIMTVGASHAAVARAYGHQDNKVKNGVFQGNEDFAREYLQLFFGIPGTSEDSDYYETISVKNNGLLLTGMNIDKVDGAYGSVSSGDWYVAPIDFTDHVDDLGRSIWNSTWHYQSDLGVGSCLEILHAEICGATAEEKLNQLGVVAGNHPESMANVPVSLVTFFADDNLAADKIDQIRGSWAAAKFNLLKFMQKYAISEAFHSEGTFKFFTAFDRNLIAQNVNTLDNEENFAKPAFWSPYGRMSSQGVKVFEPIRNVFGHQTGIDAANNSFIFKDAYDGNTLSYYYHSTSEGTYTLSDGGEPILWQKDWASVIPVNSNGDYSVAEVSTWLWNRFIADGGKNFDVIARAQVQSLLATGYDFGFAVDPDNRDPDPFYSSEDISGGHALAAQTFTEHASTVIDLTTKEGNERIGMAINFITMTPYAFALEGK